MGFRETTRLDAMADAARDWQEADAGFTAEELAAEDIGDAALDWWSRLTDEERAGAESEYLANCSDEVNSCWSYLDIFRAKAEGRLVGEQAYYPSRTVHLIAQMLTGQDAAARAQAVERLVELENERNELLEERKLLQEQETLSRQIIARYTVLDRRHQRRERLALRDGRRKLTFELVNEMRLAWNKGHGMSIGQLAKRYHCSKSTVWNIVHGYYWAND